MLRLLCCCCDQGAAEETFERSVGLSRRAQERAGQLTVSGLRVSGNGQILAEQAVLQDRAYWEVTIEDAGRSFAFGVALYAPALKHSVGVPPAIPLQEQCQNNEF